MFDNRRITGPHKPSCGRGCFRQVGRKASPPFAAHFECAAKGVRAYRARVTPQPSCIIRLVGHRPPPGTAISNTATASYTIVATPLTSTGAVTVNTAACIAVGVKVELLQYNAAGSAVTVQPGAYSTSGLTGRAFCRDLPIRSSASGSATPTALPATLTLAPLAPGSAYSPKEPIFLRVTSYDANINPLVNDHCSGDADHQQRGQ